MQLPTGTRAAAHAGRVARGPSELPRIVQAPGVHAARAREADRVVAPRRDGREAQPAGARARHLQAHKYVLGLKAGIALDTRAPDCNVGRPYLRGHFDLALQLNSSAS